MLNIGPIPDFLRELSVELAIQMRNLETYRLKRHSKATRRAPAYSPVLRQIRGVDHRAYFKQQGVF